jgi:hypothetical protein
MTALLLGPFTLWAWWLVLIALTTGVGLLVRRLVWREHRIDTDSVFAAFWLGIAALVLFLHCWHFAFPVGRVAFAIFVATGLCGLLALAAPGVAWLRSVPSSRVWAYLAICAAVGWWLANNAMGLEPASDTLMYHASAVEWYGEQPVVPGFANLQPRFGFNQSSFLLAALIEGGPFGDSSHILTPGIFLVAMLAQIIVSLCRLPYAVGSRRVRAAFDSVLLVPVFGLASSGVVLSSLDSTAPAALTLFAGISLIVGRVRTREDEQPAVAPDGLAIALLLVTTAVTFNFTLAFVALAAWLVALVRLWREDVNRSRVSIAAALSVVLIGTWLARGVVISGYPLYPMDILGAPVDWRVPVEQTHAEQGWMHYAAFARHTSAWGNIDPAHVCNPRLLLGLWVQKLFLPESWWRVPLPIVLAVGLVAVGLRAKPQGGESRLMALWCGVFVLAALVWFLKSPRPDRVLAVMWSGTAIAASFAALATSRHADRRIVGTPGGSGVRSRAREAAPWLPVVSVVTLALVPLGVFVGVAASRSEAGLMSSTLSALVSRPDPVDWYSLPRWNYPLKGRVTDSGLALMVATEHRCARGPLLCTSHFASNLRLREPGNLRAGFAVDGGEWKAEGYPNPSALGTEFLMVWRKTQEQGCVSRP